MIGRTVLRAWVLLALAFGGAGGARAENFNFSYQVSGLNVMGTFVGAAQGNGRYLITDIINGFRGGSAITLYAPLQDFNDNILIWPQNPGYFTDYGFAYQSSGVLYHTYRETNGLYYEENSRNPGAYAFNLAVAPAPHPGGGLLSFLALGLFGLVHYRRRIVGRVRRASRSGAPRAMVGRAALRAWVLLALAFGGAGGAWAQNFDFSYQVAGLNATGTFVTTALGNNRFQITSILNGLRGGNTITLLAPGSFVGNSDNILLLGANPGYFTDGGIDYTSGGKNYNLYFDNNNNNADYIEFASDSTAVYATNVYAPAPHPGGGGLSFLALGLFGLFHCRRAIVGRVRARLAPSRPAPVPAAP